MQPNKHISLPLVVLVHQNGATAHYDVRNSYKNTVSGYLRFTFHVMVTESIHLKLKIGPSNNEEISWRFTIIWFKPDGNNII
jgi:hypothetical protein